MVNIDCLFSFTTAKINRTLMRFLEGYRMSSLVLGFQEMEKTQLLLVGGKGLNLGELSKIQGIQVPEGFCVTTEGYQKAIEQNETFHAIVGSTNNAKSRGSRSNW